MIRKFSRILTIGFATLKLKQTTPYLFKPHTRLSTVRLCNVPKYTFSELPKHQVLQVEKFFI
jgi:hypothetical protein